MKKRSVFQIFSRLIVLVKPLTGWMLLAITLGFAGHLCATFITVEGIKAVLQVLNDPSRSLTALFIFIAVMALFRGLLRYGEQGCNHNIAFRLLAIIRHHVFTALRKLTPAKLEGRDKGDLINLITSDIELLEVFYAHTISPIFIALLMTIFMTVYISAIHPLLGLCAFAAYAFVGLVIPYIIHRRSLGLGSEFRSQSGQLSSFVLESLRGITESQQYQMEHQRMKELDEKTHALSENERQSKLLVGQNMALSNTAVLGFDLIMLMISILLCFNGQISFSGALIATVALMSSFGPVIALANLGSTLQNTLAAGNRVLDLLDETPSVEEITSCDPADFGDIEASNLSFSYDQEEILSNVSLSIPRNKVTGIVGKSGSGKSTFLKLLMRFWKTQQGQITINGRSIDQINTSDLRNMESYVTQETHLFHDSIANNLRIAKQDATQQEIENACRKASIHDWIMTLPQGYETPVGELGDTLSGGERQRLGLARAFLHDSELMLLDEPTSNLDSLNEAVILNAIARSTEGKTIVLVSHRASTMALADQSYTMENGRVS